MSDENFRDSRRNVIKKAGGLLGLAAVVSLARVETAKADGGTMSPASVAYQDTPKGSQQCSNCSLLVPGTQHPGMGCAKPLLAHQPDGSVPDMVIRELKPVCPTIPAMYLEHRGIAVE